MSAARKGRPVHPATKAALEAIRHLPRKPHSEKTKALMRSRRGKVVNAALVSPSGERHVVHKNIAAFCREHGLSHPLARSSLARVIRGVAKSYMGWRLADVG